MLAHILSQILIHLSTIQVDNNSLVIYLHLHLLHLQDSNKLIMSFISNNIIISTHLAKAMCQNRIVTSDLDLARVCLAITVTATSHPNQMTTKTLYLQPYIVFSEIQNSLIKWISRLKLFLEHQGEDSSTIWIAVRITAIVIKIQIRYNLII